jgi:hypothetical protein
MACGDIGSYEGPAKEFAQFVANTDPDGQCQHVKVGVSSPGPVGNNEVLARFVFAPPHLLQSTGKIDESLVDDAFTHGASVNRAHSGWEVMLPELHAKGEELAEKIRTGSEKRPPQPSRRYLGFIRLSAEDVRSSSVDETPTRVRIYDTSLPHDDFHGDIVVNSSNLRKDLKKALKTLLYLKLTNAGLFRSPYLTDGIDFDALGIPVHVS